MRNWNQYLELWQQKRNELQISTDIHADWSDMHHLLNQQMPVQNPSGSGNSGSGSVLSHLAKFKLLYIIAGFIAAGMVTYLVLSKIDNKADKRLKKDKIEIRKDSLRANSALVADSLQNLNENTKDSLRDDENHSTVNTPSVNVTTNSNPGASNPAGDSKAGSATSVMKANRNSSGLTAADNRVLSSSAGLVNGVRLRNTRPGLNNHTSRNNSRGNANNRNVAIRQGRSRNNDYGQTPDNSSGLFNMDRHRDSTPLLEPATVQSRLTWEDVVANSSQQPDILASPFSAVRRLSAEKNAKAAKTPAGGSNLDWGLLLGINAQGSFTSKAQNHNIYGSLPVDIYVGAFTTYNFTDRWALGLQGRILTPHIINGSFNHTHPIIVDSVPIVQTFKISGSHKSYTIDVPLHLIYKATPNISVKAGPLLSIPIKTIFGSNALTAQTNKDTTRYFDTLASKIKTASFEKKIRYGVSAGVGFSYKLLWFDATYNYNFQKQKVSTAIGGYSANTNSLQFTIGIKLNKSKK